MWYQGWLCQLTIVAIEQVGLREVMDLEAMLVCDCWY